MAYAARFCSFRRFCPGVSSFSSLDPRPPRECAVLPALLLALPSCTGEWPRGSAEIAPGCGAAAAAAVRSNGWPKPAAKAVS